MDDAPRARLKALAKPAGCVAVMVGRGRVAVLSQERALALGLHAAPPWTRDLADRVLQAEGIDRIRRRALGWLARGPVSRLTLREKLTADGADTGAVASALDELAAQGWLDDARTAQAVAKVRSRKGALGSAQVEHELVERGFDPSLARQAASKAFSKRNAVDDAVSVLRAQMGHKPGDPAAQRRRAFALLARRGFEEDVVERAIEKVLGAPEFDDLS